MPLSADQVLALAPDAASVGAARRLAAPHEWSGLGQSEAALWGEIRGSALYQVRVDKADLVAKCSCPSRKLPCKHALALLLLAAEGAPLPQAEPPAWVAEWLAGRTRRRSADRTAPVDAEAQAKRRERRESRVQSGLDALELWMGDVLRDGLAALEARPEGFFEQMAARLTDAQAPGLASRVRRLAWIVGSGGDWPRRFLDELGLLALLVRAARRLDRLDAPLAADVRQLLGLTQEKDAVLAGGETVDDEWFVAGQSIVEDDRFKSQRTWLFGAASGRRALLLQFAASGAPFPELIAAGTRVTGKLAFFPGAAPLRALVVERRATADRFGARLPGHARIDALLDEMSLLLARQPWLDRLGCVLRDVAVLLENGGALRVRDADGATLPLAAGDHAKLLALSGGHPLDLCAEWDGRALQPLSAVVGGELVPLRSAA